MRRSPPRTLRQSLIMLCGSVMMLSGIYATYALKFHSPDLWAALVICVSMGLMIGFLLTKPNITIAQPELPTLPSAKDVAIDALRRLGNLNHSGGIMLIDIGLLSYDGGTQPKVIRTETIPAYATQLRPFVLLNFAARHKPTFTLKFEITDEHGQVRFIAEEKFSFQHGKNFCTPRNWLPMGDDEPGGNWSLHVSLSDHPLALHDFTVAPDAAAYFRAYLRPDGEIDEWLSKSASSVPTENLSLDEMLKDQDGKH